MKTEFEFIQYIKKSFGLRAVGDDCAVLPKDDSTDMLVTADLLIEDIDFQLDWTTPEFLGHKALAVSLSDVAAMGGNPVWAMLTVGVPTGLWNTDFLKRLYAGWHELAAVFHVELVGGDLSRSPDKLVIDSIVGGNVEKGKAVLRSGAKPGDRIYVSGRLGGAAGGIQLLRSSKQMSMQAEERKPIARLLRPLPRVELGRYLLKNGIASAMIDLSDGLSTDLYHVCEASQVGAEIDASLIPVDTDLNEFFGSDQALALALNGGEDFELLFTASPESTSAFSSKEFSHIGTITDKSGVVELTDRDRVVALRPSGYRHF
jgi:thiamine-monophosphate kinase